MYTAAILSTLVLSAFSFVNGHGYVQEVVADGVSYTGYLPYSDPYYNPVPERIIRAIPGNGPVTDITLIDLQCNGDSADGIIGTSPAPIYGTGPMITYMAAAPEGTNVTAWMPGIEAVWFKVAEAGKTAAGLWASTDILTENDSIYTFTVPTSLKPGQYIIRHEIIALQSAYVYPGAQFYPSCIQLEITGSGSAFPTSFVSFPGAYTPDTPGIAFDVYTNTSSFNFADFSDSDVWPSRAQLDRHLKRPRAYVLRKTCTAAACMTSSENSKVEFELWTLDSVSYGTAVVLAVAVLARRKGCSRDRNESNQETATKVREASVGRRAWIVTCDLSSKEQIGGVIQRITSPESENGLGLDIDILVNCGGIQRRHPAELFPDDDWQEVLQVNLSSVWTLSRDVGHYMLARRERSNDDGVIVPRGKIINIASLLSYQGGFTVPAYAAAKHGVLGATKALSNEWSAKGINVNCIAPGYIDTEMNTALINNPTRARQILERIPAGRWGSPADFEGAVVFLASAASDYVCGETLTIDGGWMAR
ncbi:hypothetical protein EW145_g4961 [Phellinidium pouzarii]|uniref:AA9 family lytic polysaccharide monooxygenase n=1 Tax=Phellinidium pouzarii TaxID=167371 RepID=A0A4S4L1P0_9AGAM|nr:hypothetical protein EW145_g4961 [Phellinidium pouzarii]